MPNCSQTNRAAAHQCRAEPGREGRHQPPGACAARDDSDPAGTAIRSESGRPVKQYLDLLQHVLDHGVHRSDRTGTGTRSVFGYQMRFDLAAGFPLVTTKKVFTKAVFGELL